jgi:hypothetical protein
MFQEYQNDTDQPERVPEKISNLEDPHRCWFSPLMKHEYKQFDPFRKAETISDGHGWNG